ncbi:MAG: DUF2339 domain-containing protein [Candidatus Kapaibacterium sp.]|nr:MAG: DUF2339 domain-containing protein [Candidatus Kapabacteria bacterium]
MEELVFGLFSMAVVLVPIYFFARNILKIRALENDVVELRRRIVKLERSQLLASEQKTSLPTPATERDTARELSTLIELETLKHPEQETSYQETNNQVTNDQATKQPAPPSKTKREWEAFIGGRVFNRIGAAAIILGIGFFLKYAFDNDLIPEWLRVAMGFVAGAGLLVGAVRARAGDLEIFAQGLLGAGLGTLYLSVYASYNFYHLVPLPVAFGGMILVTALGFLMALRFESLPTALIAWFGGFITPLLFHTTTPNIFGLFTYLLLLNIGLLALVLMRDAWYILKPLSFAATYGIAFLWYIDKYTTLEHFALALTFACLYAVVFFAVDMLRAAQNLVKTDVAWRKQEVAVCSTIAYAPVWVLMLDAAPTMLPIVTVCFVLAYLLASEFLRRRVAEDTWSFRRTMTSVILLIVIATQQQFSREWLVIAWSVEMAVMFYIAWWVYKDTFLWLVVTLLGGLLWGMFMYVEYIVFLNKTGTFHWLTLAVYCSIIASFLAVALMYEQMRRDGEFLAGNILGALASQKGGTWLAGNVFHFPWAIQGAQFLGYLHRVLFDRNGSSSALLSEDALLSPAWSSGAFIVMYVAYFLGLAWLGRRMKWREITQISLVIWAIFLVVILKGFAYEPATAWQFLWNKRVLSLVVSLAATLALMRVWDDNNETMPELIKKYIPFALSICAFLLVFTLLSGEASDYWHSQIMHLYALPQGAAIEGRIAELENGKQLTLSLVWLVYALTLMAAGLVKRVWGLRVAALGLSLLSIAKIFLLDLSFLTTPYRIGSFIGLGVVLMLLSYLYQRYKDIIFADEREEK